MTEFTLAEIKSGTYKAGQDQWLIAEVERLEALRTEPWSSATYAAVVAEGMEAAAKVAPQEPAGIRSGDEGFWTGWLRGVREFRAAILAVAKDTTTHHDGGDAKETI